jgi:hypothetical protein
VWDFERVGNQVHHIGLSVADNDYTIDAYYTAQPSGIRKKSMPRFRRSTMSSNPTTSG